ncbi:MAG: nickel pincer cofactor biosynthesis protein LarC [Oscillospiraceae bacterium]|nr:nickel pincer cofactor biosynthesis protein LarC [Oscillospiraceae bacterium]
MKILYFDCFSGISGDMTLAALLDLEPRNFDYLLAQLKTLNINGWSINTERRNKNGINANYIKVILPEPSHSHSYSHHDSDNNNHSHEHRNFEDIIHIIDNSKITKKAKELSKNIFKRIAVAEAKIHGTEIDRVNFHEVGAVDSIIDITGAAVLLDLLVSQNKIEKIYCSVVNDGHGFTHCQHGKIPVPAPATVEIFANAGVKTNQIDVPKELVTPTGAAIIAEIAGNFGFMPEMSAIKTGYGAGTRDLEIPNVLRVILGEFTVGAIINRPLKENDDGIFRAIDNRSHENITIIETNIDDCPAEILAYTMEKLLKEGANDVFFTPVYMKKNRPAVKLTVLCKKELTDKLSKIILSETTTIGIRMREEKRICLERKSDFIKTVYGDLKVKEIEFDGERKIMPEYEDAKKLAENANVPLYKIYDSVKN